MLTESDLSVFMEQVVLLLWWVEVDVKECIEEEWSEDYKQFQKYFFSILVNKLFKTFDGRRGEAKFEGGSFFISGLRKNEKVKNRK